MTDIVQELRDWARVDDNCGRVKTAELHSDAADEIARLRAEVERLKGGGGMPDEFTADEWELIADGRRLHPEIDWEAVVRAVRAEALTWVKQKRHEVERLKKTN